MANRSNKYVVIKNAFIQKQKVTTSCVGSSAKGNKKPFTVIWFFFVFTLMFVPLAKANDQTFAFDIPQQRADGALTALADQADISVVFDYDAISKYQANKLKGRYKVQEAVELLLAGTLLNYQFESNGHLIITLHKDSDGDTDMGIKSKKKLFAAITSVFIGAGSVQEVVAQGEVDGQRDTGWRLEEIIVTATKRSQGLQDTAMAISVLSDDVIDKRNLVGMGDYLSSLPGVSVLDQGPGFNSVVIRGLAADPQNEGFNSSPVTGVYFGETAISGFGVSGNSADIKLVDMERIEVLRGPQGTLYGAGAMGGVVRNIPAAPDLSQLEGALNLGYSNTGEEGGGNNMVKGVINIPVIDDKLAIRAVAYRFDNSGYYKNIAASDPLTSAAAITFGATAVDKDDVGSNDVQGGRISVLWQPMDELMVNLSYLTQDIEQRGWGQADLELAGGFSQRRLSIRTNTTPPDYGVGDQDEGLQDDIEITNLALEYNFDWGSVSSSTSWVDEESEINRDLSAFFASSGYFPWSQPVSFSASFFSEEIRLTSDFDEPLQFLLGFYYEKKEIGIENFGLFSGGNPALNAFAPGEILLLHNTTDREQTQHAIFGELSYDLTEQIKLTVGGRVFKYDRDETLEEFDSPFAASSVSVVDSDENDVSLKVGIEYTPNDDALLYATWSEGFRLGFPVPAETLPASICDQDGDGFYDGSNGISTGPRQIDSDFVENFELGGKFSLLDNRLTVNAALYQINWEGIPIAQAFDFCAASSNAGEAQSRGIELELTYYLNEQILINFSSSYVDAELTEDAPELNAENGDRLPGSPKYNASLGLEYGFALAGYEAYLRGDYAYVGGFYNNLQEEGTEAGDYGKLNINVGVTMGQVDIGVSVDNLTNEDSITWIDSEGYPTERGNRLRPRTIGFSVGYRF